MYRNSSEVVEGIVELQDATSSAPTITAAGGDVGWPQLHAEIHGLWRQRVGVDDDSCAARKRCAGSAGPDAILQSIYRSPGLLAQGPPACISHRAEALSSTTKILFQVVFPKSVSECVSRAAACAAIKRCNITMM